MSFNSEKIDIALEQIAKASDEAKLEALRIKYLGRKSELAKALAELSKMPMTNRKKLGKQLNEKKNQLEAKIEERRQELLKLQVSQDKDYLDLTVPGISGLVGHSHPVSQLLSELMQYFLHLGFTVADGPEIESEWYCFDALNIPPDHPARDMQDTFYLENGLVPRTHTSSVQIRYMEANQPPIRIVAPGRVYRNEDEDPTHLWSFHQIEGLVVDKGIHLGHLKATLLGMVQAALGRDTNIRLRPNYFPYVEPAVEIDVTCVNCQGKGCRTCSKTGWIELLGAGMVHNQVLENVGIDPKTYSGFAFGLGLERLAALKYNVPDIRAFWHPDLRFLEQF